VLLQQCIIPSFTATPLNYAVLQGPAVLMFQADAVLLLLLPLVTSMHQQLTVSSIAVPKS
jgi:hypothetical protein